jgi:hypothetical protein
MRRTNDSIQYLNLKHKGELLYIPMNNRIVSYSYPSMEKKSEVFYNDEILDFHIFNSSQGELNLAIIAKSTKAITLFNEAGDKISEL